MSYTDETAALPLSIGHFDFSVNVRTLGAWGAFVILFTARLAAAGTPPGLAMVEKILTQLELPAEPPRPSPARTPAWLPGVRTAADDEDAPGAHWPD